VLEPDGVLRRATYEDLDALSSLDPLVPLTRDRTALMSQRIASGECWVVERDGHVDGYVVVRGRHFFGRDFVESLVVSPRARRRGVGRRLLGHAVKTSSTSDVFTSTNRSNRAMILLLEQGRWRLSGELEGLDEGDPELVYFTHRP
jgi:ribosomal protein S18 acetylase RimI-like enzyme